MSNSLNPERRYELGTASGNEAGFALPAVLLLLMVLSTVSAFFLANATNEQRAGRAMRESARSFYATEAGLNLIMARWDSLSYDTLFANAGDSVALAWETLPENGCSFGAMMRRVDDGSGIPSYLAKVSGRGPGGGFGGQRNLSVVLKAPPGAWGVGLVLGGGGELSGSASITGPCGGVHSNAPIWKGGKNLTIDGGYTVVDSPPLDTLIYRTYWDSDGNPSLPTAVPDPMPIPQLSPLDYCPGQADWILRNNSIIRVSPYDSTLVGAVGDTWGFELDTEFGQPKYKLSGGSTPQTGTLCVFGNIELSGGAGTDGAPIDMSIIATGNIQLTGTSFISGNTDGIAALAGGDIWLTGSAGILTDNFSGLIYANGECEMSGSSSITGQIICAGNPPPGPFAPDITPVGNEFSGSMKIKFDCSTPLANGIGVQIQPGSWTDLSY